MDQKLITSWRVFYAKAWHTYGKTPQEYRDLYVAQYGCCYVCRVAKGKHPDDPKGRGGRRLGWDHNHTTGVVRGLLCTGGDRTCNRIIGWLNTAALRRAVEYVENPPAPRVVEAVARGERDLPYWLDQAHRDEFLRGILGLK
jgi:hypothetical protein